MDAINWNDLLGKAVETTGTVIAAKVDKPLSNTVQAQPTNQLTPAQANAQASAAADLGIKNAQPSAISKYLPYLIGGGVLVVGAFFLLAARSASK